MLKVLRQKRAFTFIEVLIVLAIVTLLSFVAVPNFIQAKRKAQDRVCQDQLRLIQHALEQYQKDKAILPGADVKEVFHAVIMGSKEAYIEEELFCPVNKAPYNVTTAGAAPTCANRDNEPQNRNFKNHILPSAP